MYASSNRQEKRWLWPTLARGKETKFEGTRYRAPGAGLLTPLLVASDCILEHSCIVALLIYPYTQTSTYTTTYRYQTQSPIPTNTALFDIPIEQGARGTIWITRRDARRHRGAR